MTEARSEVGVQAEAQWAVIDIRNNFRASDESIAVKGAYLKWGKFHAATDKDTEVSIDDINKIVVAKGQSGKIYTSGRANASSGTEGGVDLYISGTSTKIASLYWNCPWGSKQNTFVIGDQVEDYPVSQEGANLNSGALGTITVKVSKAG